jgi:glycerol-3-phosphate O-acyltransferase
VSHVDLVEACRRLGRTLSAFGARFTPSLADPDRKGDIRVASVAEACELFARAGHVEVKTPGVLKSRRGSRPRPGPDAIYVVPDEARLSLDLSKNIVVHFFVSRALVATALLGAPASDTPPPGLTTPQEGRGCAVSALADALRERVRALSRLFKYEFQFRADASFEQIFDETIGSMEKDGEILREGNLVRVASENGHAQVALYAEIVRNFVEGYRVAARGLVALLRGPLTIHDAARRAIATGERMFLAGDIERREAVSGPIIENAYAAFIDQGYVSRSDGKIRLPESYATQSAVRTIEARIASYLARRREATP